MRGRYQVCDRVDLAGAHGAGQQKNLEKAIKVLEQGVKKHPGNADIHYNLGVDLGRSGRLDEAAAAYRKAIKLDSSLYRAHYNLGALFGKQGKLDEALAAFHQAIKIKPDFAEGYCNLGVVLAKQGKLDDAIKAYQQAIRCNPGLAKAYHNLGLVLREKGRLDDAIEAYKNAIRYKPDYALAYNNLGACLYKHDRLEEAVEAFRKAVALQPQFPDPYHNLGWMYSKLGMLDDALRAFEQGIKLESRPKAFLRLGIVLYEQRRLDEAESRFRQAARPGPDSMAAHYNLGLVLREKGDIESALAAFQQAQGLSTNPEIARRIEECRRSIELAGSLKGRLGRKLVVPDAKDKVILARLHHSRKHYLTSAQLWKEAFTADPKLQEEDEDGSYLRRAAAAAALASAGDGVEKIDAAGRRKWCRTAIQWLRTGLSQQEALLGSEEDGARYQVIWMLRMWKQDPRLRAIRDEEQLKQLPDSDREEIRVFWADVDSLLARSLQKD